MIFIIIIIILFFSFLSSPKYLHPLSHDVQTCAGTAVFHGSYNAAADDRDQSAPRLRQPTPAAAATTTAFNPYRLWLTGGAIVSHPTTDHRTSMTIVLTTSLR